MSNRLKELREIYETRFHTIPHSHTFEELLNIAEKLEVENERLKRVIESTCSTCKDEEEFGNTSNNWESKEW